MAKSNPSQRDTAENKTMKQQLKSISKEMKMKEAEEKRMEDIKLLELVAANINQRIIDVTNMKRSSRKSGKTLRKEDILINNKILLEYLDKNGVEYNEQGLHSMTTLIGALLDIARCQIKDQISSYHIAIRLMYFGEKFYAYFGENYLSNYQGMVDAYQELFNSWNLKTAYFDSVINGKTIYVKVPINAPHIFSKVKPETLLPESEYNVTPKTASGGVPDEPVMRGECECGNEECQCGGNCQCKEHNAGNSEGDSNE